MFSLMFKRLILFMLLMGLAAPLTALNCYTCQGILCDEEMGMVYEPCDGSQWSTNLKPFLSPRVDIKDLTKVTENAYWVCVNGTGKETKDVTRFCFLDTGLGLGCTTEKIEDALPEGNKEALICFCNTDGCNIDEKGLQILSKVNNRERLAIDENEDSELIFGNSTAPKLQFTEFNCFSLSFLVRIILGFLGGIFFFKL